MNELADILKGRQAIYEFLFVASYKVPDNSFKSLIIKSVPYFSALAASCENADLKEGAAILSEFTGEIHNMDDTDVAGILNTSFTELYLIGSKSVELKETVWREGEWQREKIILSLSDYFARDNVVKPTVVNLPIDSYPMELFYLFKTAEKAAASDKDTAKNIIARQIEFMDIHILRWHRKFQKEVLKACDVKELSAFYKAVVLLAAGFVEFDRVLADGIF